jgi:hypothetical protein
MATDKAAITKWNEQRPLERHDWDFTECPKKQLPFCFRYEYCRESEFVKVAQHLQQNHAKIPVGILSLISEALAHIPDYFPDFHKRPWLDLLEAERVRYIKDREEIAKITQPLIGFSILTNQDLERCAGLSLQNTWLSLQQMPAVPALVARNERLNTQQGLFQITAGFPKKEIIDQFRRYLDRIQRDQPNFFHANSGGRGGPMDRLKELGAYRILYGRSPALAYKFVRRHSNSKEQPCHLYHEDKAGKGNSWYRAREAAELTIRQFDELACNWLDYFKTLK